ncbi:hypothetical protein LCGC14_0748010 [marine sediment metagenome]|uniref:Uncharacterized protein n=1 Tax=marine sediment metagenome TaxID=412755 RepID=A0A0F9Q4U0_9ZZZZ|nr:MAG: hypothetical protein Lokiarch_13920 [Candidatus Lokiarchaeum sp. GC14_75]
MAITKLAPKTDLNSLDNSTHIQFICPVCKTKKSLKFPKTVISQAKGLTTMSIARGLVCKHQFQAFVDKNFMVRAYQKVDFEFEKIKSEEEKKEQPEDDLKNDIKLFENLILEGDYLEYKPKVASKMNNNDQKNYKQENKLKPKIDLQELYEEFWEFIDENNKVFKDFIKNDARRKKLYPLY